MKKRKNSILTAKPLLTLALAVILSVPALAESLVPGGAALGIRISTDGVIVADVTSVETENGSASPAADAGIRTGDIIVRVGGRTVESTGDFMEAMSSLTGDTVSVTFEREGKQRQVNVSPAVCPDGALRLGILLKDGVAGVGTLTFYDPDTGLYGALGHSISDAETGDVIPLRDGEIYSAEISGVTRGEIGSPGALNGSADPGCVLGDIGLNCSCGIFGRAKFDFDKTVETGEMKPGKALILCTLSGDGVCEYGIEISRVYKSGEGCTAALRVTDERLIEKTGGIVQGMSGSPIIQDGRLVGAVTHVFINDPTGGYGISIQDMLAAAQRCTDKAA